MPAVRALGRQPGPPSWWLRRAEGAGDTTGLLCPQRAGPAHGLPGKEQGALLLRCPLSRRGLGRLLCCNPLPIVLQLQQARIPFWSPLPLVHFS